MNLFSIDELSAPAEARAIRELKKDDYYFGHTREKILSECIAEIAVPRWLFSILFADIRKDVAFPRIEIGRLNIHAENPSEVAGVIEGLGLTERLTGSVVEKISVSYQKTSFNSVTKVDRLEVSDDGGLDLEGIICSAVRDLVQRVNVVAVDLFERAYSVDAILEHINEFERVFDVDGELIV